MLGLDSDPGVSGRQRRGAIPGGGSPAIVRVGERNLAPEGLRPAETPGQRTGAPLAGQDDRIEPGTDGAPDPVLPARQRSQAAITSATSIRAALHGREHRTVGRSGRGTRSLSDSATQKILQRELYEFHDTRYVRLAQLPVAHVYRLRKSRGYLQRLVTYQRTRPTQVTIGERRKPTAALRLPLRSVGVFNRAPEGLSHPHGFPILQPELAERLDVRHSGVPAC